jgi:subtilisin family serine protease
MKWRKRYLSALLSISFTLGSFPVYSSANSGSNLEESNSQENYTYLLKSPKQTKEVLKMIKNQFPTSNVRAIEEIGLIYVKNDKDIDINEIENIIIEYIDVQGELPDLISPSRDTVTTNNHLNEVKKFTPDKSELAHPSVTNVAYPLLNSATFTPYNWYLKDVTSDYQHLSIDKGEHATIALIDSGVDMEHPLIKDHIDLTAAKNYVTNDMDMTDELGHGTTIAGIMASIAPETRIVPYKVVGNAGGESEWVIDAITDAANDAHDVISLSIGTYLIKSEEEEKLLIRAYDRAVKYAKSKGSVVIASAGNDGFNLDELKPFKFKHLPGGLHDVVTVSSNTKQNNLAYYSNFGKEVDFTAPGGSLFDENGYTDTTEMIITTFPTDRLNTPLDQLLGIPQGYTLTEGTSYAVPQVSAAAALIISEHTERTGNQPAVQKVIKYLERGSSDIGKRGKDPYFGEGKVNAYQSLTMMNE